jgi:putative ABC transport system permease protein
MDTKELIKTANRNLLRNKLRTLLTILAIFVGSFTLTMTNAVGDGVKDYIEKQVKNYEGSAVLFINKKRETKDEEALNSPAEYKEETTDTSIEIPKGETMTFAQIDALFKTFPDVESFTPSYYQNTEYITLDGNKKYRVRLNALAKGMTQKIEVGSQINGKNQIILQFDIAKAINENLETLIGKNATVGYKLSVGNTLQTIQLKVVGVATKGLMGSFSSTVDAETERQIYEVQQKNSPDYDKFYNFSFQLKTSDAAKIAEIKKQLDEKGFDALTYADQNKRTYDAVSIFQYAMGLFAFIALLAASFGIINTLVIAVMERTKEIGLQKALGMSKGKIFTLFSLESILIGFWGAVLGIVTAIILGTIANIFASTYYLESFEGYNLVVFKPLSIIFVILLITIIAFLAGVLPAFRASRLNPIEALRYE